jgi:hypothetical protein
MLVIPSGARKPPETCQTQRAYPPLKSFCALAYEDVVSENDW